jgi:hypothetical protein
MCEAEPSDRRELIVLRLRILNLQALVCELLDKNERLRFAAHRPNQDCSALDLFARADSRRSTQPDGTHFSEPRL